MPWEVVIGLEVHVQLNTATKIFSGASTRFGAAPNSQTSVLDLAYPGVLPVLNEAAVDCAIRLGLALGSHINQKTIFARKNYFYPDLPKGYQISQLDAPIVEQGTLAITLNGEEKTIRLTRAHLEEDAGKSLHEDFHGRTGIDLNRAGTPLLEVVSEPDMRSAEEAAAYARALYDLVTWLGICDGNMQEGSFRMDANVSVREQGQSALGKRCEIKNLNSFRFLVAAIDYEVARQIDLMSHGQPVRQETRLYDANRHQTRSMRSKEDAHDYRYFPDPDLLPLLINAEHIERVRASMPPLPGTMKARFIAQYGLSCDEASQLTTRLDLAQYFDTLARLSGLPKLAANWMLGEMAAYLNRYDLALSRCPLTPKRMGGLLQRIADHTLSSKLAKEVFDAMWLSDDSADAIIDARSLRQMSDENELSALVDSLIASHAAMVAEFLAGKEKALNALVGQIMKATQGKANPAQVQAILKKKLEQSKPSV